LTVVADIVAISAVGSGTVADNAVVIDADSDISYCCCLGVTAGVI
jgi:hypothetical protein